MRAKLLGVATQIFMMAVLISIVLLLLGIGTLVLIHVCIVGRAFRRGLSTMTRAPAAAPAAGDDRSSDCAARAGLLPTDLERIPCFEFGGRGGGGSPAADCAVCLEGFESGDRCRMLQPCRHSFHAACVDHWLMKTAACPICRTGVGVGDLRSSSVVFIDEPSLPPPDDASTSR